MPYIDPDNRERYDSAVNELLAEIARTSNKPGADFNYIVSRLAGGLVLLLHWRGGAGGVPGYTVRAAVLGHFSAALREFERRVLDPYEEGAQAKMPDIPEYVN